MGPNCRGDRDVISICKGLIAAENSGSERACKLALRSFVPSFLFVTVNVISSQPTQPSTRAQVLSQDLHKARETCSANVIPRQSVI